MKKLNLFIPISKIDEEQRLVYGVLAQEELDNSGEVFDYKTSKPHFEKWSDDQFNASNGKSKGNVRAMHTSVAAGKLTDISYNDNEKLIEGCAKVIDDGEWNKVLEGVYTGFSMGGRYEKRWTKDGNTHYTAVPVEMSLVDKPCIKSALFAGMKKSFEFTLGENILEKADDELRKEQERDENGRFAGGGGSDTKGFSEGDKVYSSHGDTARVGTIEGSANNPDTHYSVRVGNSLQDIPKDSVHGTREEAKTAFGEGHTKSDNGEKTMYVPTNDEILPVARALAKAAGQTEAAWLDFVPAATEQLVAEKGDNPFAHTDEDCKAKDCDKCAEKAAKAADLEPVKDTEDSTEVDDDKEETGKDKAKKSDDPNEEHGGEGPLEDAIAKADVEQVWIAKADGKQFKKKADAVAHDLAVQKGDVAEPSLKDLLTAATDTVAAIVKGDEGDPVAETIATLDEQCAKLAAFLGSPEVAEKSVYHVSRMAEVLSSLGSLYQSVVREADAEKDASAVPGALIAGVESLGNALIAMATEEVGEMMERLREGEDDNMCYPEMYCDLAVSTLGLEKADTKAYFDKAVEAAAPLLAKRAAPVIAAVTVTIDPVVEDDMTKMAKAAGFESVVEHLQDQLSKRTTELEEITPLVKTLAADVAALKSMPRPAAPRLNIVGKSDDVQPQGAPVAKAADVLAGLTGPEIARLAIKMAQQNGHTISSGQ